MQTDVQAAKRSQSGGVWKGASGQSIIRETRDDAVVRSARKVAQMHHVFRSVAHATAMPVKPSEPQRVSQRVSHWGSEAHCRGNLAVSHARLHSGVDTEHAA
jgi:hypothetical protein